MSKTVMEQSDRQRREIKYHRGHAAKYVAMASQPVTLTRLTSHRYRWWNAYWVNMWRARSENLPNRRVLVVGSGFGEDAITLDLLLPEGVRARGRSHWRSLRGTCCAVHLQSHLRISDLAAGWIVDDAWNVRRGAASSADRVQTTDHTERLCC